MKENKFNKSIKGDSPKDRLDEVHSKDLGLHIPEGYFDQSQNKILDQIHPEKKSKIVQLFKNSNFWYAAAGIALVVALSVFKPNVLPNFDGIPGGVYDSVEQLDNYSGINANPDYQEDWLITSLFVDESQVDAYVDQYIIEESIIDEIIDVYFFDELQNDALLF